MNARLAKGGEGGERNQASRVKIACCVGYLICRSITEDFWLDLDISNSCHELMEVT